MKRIVEVSFQGIQFGNAWFSHESITGYTADQLNSGSCGIIGQQYRKWIEEALVPPAGGEPEVISIVEPQYYDEDMGCGLEDRNITDRYEAMQHGWDCCVQRFLEQIPDDIELVDRAHVTRLQAEVENRTSQLCMSRTQLGVSLRRNENLQSELTKARELIGAMTKGFNILSQVGGEYSINLSFAHRDDAWDAYSKLCKFNKLAHQSTPAAKDDSE